MINIKAYNEVLEELSVNKVTLVAVSKTKPNEDIKAMYELGQRDFGENYVQELVDKQASLPTDIKWHFIGHLQSNKVKYIAPFVHLIHGVDSFKLLEEINKQGKKNHKIIDCLLQVHIAEEETKFGFDEADLNLLFNDGLSQLKNINIKGIMGMASFSEDSSKVRKEFEVLKEIYDKFSLIKNTNCHFSIISMGMSGDYKIAIEEGSNMVRIGSLLFGKRS